MPTRTAVSRACRVAVLCGFALNAASAATTRMVGAAAVPLRAAPNDKAYSVLSVSAGTRVTVRNDTHTDWVGVEAPRDAGVWVYGDLVREERIIAPRMLVRAGPGIDYEGVGQLQKGDRVRIRGRQDDWLRIDPPPGTILWLKRDDLAAPKAPDPPPPAPAPAPEPEPVPVTPKRHETVVPVVPPEPVRPTAGLQPAPTPPREPSVPFPVRPAPRAPKPPAPAPETFAGAIEAGEATAVPKGAVAGKQITLTGQLKRAPIFPRDRYSNFRLVQRNEKGQRVTVCYLVGPEARLRALVGHRVQVSGTEYTVPGKRAPALALRSIELAP